MGRRQHLKYALFGMPRLFNGPKATSDPPIWRGGQNPAVSKNSGTHVRTAPGPGRSPCHPAAVAGWQRKGVIHNR